QAPGPPGAPPAPPSREALSWLGRANQYDIRGKSWLWLTPPGGGAPQPAPGGPADLDRWNKAGRTESDPGPPPVPFAPAPPPPRRPPRVPRPRRLRPEHPRRRPSRRRRPRQGRPEGEALPGFRHPLTHPTDATASSARAGRGARPPRRPRWGAGRRRPGWRR